MIKKTKKPLSKTKQKQASRLMMAALKGSAGALKTLRRLTGAGGSRKS